MKKITGAAIALAAAIAVGGGAMAIPSQAASSDSSNVGSRQYERGHHSHATISATITGIPSTATSSRAVGLGAYFNAYVLTAGVTAPSTAPSDSHRIHLGLGRGHDDTAVRGSTLTQTLRLPTGDAGSTTRVALYPSDGSAPAIVTVKVDDAGVATVTSSKPLTVAYSLNVAAETKANMSAHKAGKIKGLGHGDERGHRGGETKGKGHHGGKGHRH